MVWPALQVHGSSEVDATSVSSGVGARQSEGGRHQQRNRKKQPMYGVEGERR